MDNDETTKLARLMRLAAVRNVLAQRLISREDAAELLKGPLNPDDESTVFDDSEMLNMSAYLDYEIIFGVEDGK